MPLDEISQVASLCVMCGAARTASSPRWRPGRRSSVTRRRSRPVRRDLRRGDRGAISIPNGREHGRVTEAGRDRRVWSKTRDHAQAHQTATTPRPFEPLRGRMLKSRRARSEMIGEPRARETARMHHKNRERGHACPQDKARAPRHTSSASVCNRLASKVTVSFFLRTFGYNLRPRGADDRQRRRSELYLRFPSAGEWRFS